jgi:ferredoxin
MRFKVLIDTLKCTGCQTCAFYCSFAKLGYFSPQRAYIKVKVNSVNGKLNDISFTEECEDCGICAHYCPYGALTKGDDPSQAAVSKGSNQ